MPLRNKQKNTLRNKIIIWSLVVILLVLMIISFSAPHNVTEIVLYP